MIGFKRNRGDKELMAKYLRFRLKMCMEEMNETIDAAIFDNDSEETVDGLIDLCVFAIGTLDVFGGRCMGSLEPRLYG